MRLPYHDLEIELQMEGIIRIESVQISQRLGEHGRAVIRALTGEEQAPELVEQADSHLTITIRRTGEQAGNLFCGQAEQVYVSREEGLYHLYMEFVGYTKEWDRTAKSQSFCRGNDTYAQVLNKVLSEYPVKEIRDEASGGAKIPGMLLQYEETDWEFIKRLASHFSTFLMADNTQERGMVYFGIPVLDYGTVLQEEEYTVLRGKERYERMEDTGDLMLQEMTGWRVRSRKALRFGEQVMLGHIETVVTAVEIFTQKGDLVTEYELSRRKGILTAKKKNPRIYGMSILATVKERKGNQIRVHFDIDPTYEASADLKYFTYAIETSNFYCMPEEGSRVHIYFPGHDEQEAMAVHALSAGSMPGGGTPAGGSAVVGGYRAVDVPEADNRAEELGERVEGRELAVKEFSSLAKTELAATADSSVKEFSGFSKATLSTVAFGSLKNINLPEGNFGGVKKMELSAEEYNSQKDLEGLTKYSGNTMEAGLSLTDVGQMTDIDGQMIDVSGYRSEFFMSEALDSQGKGDLQGNNFGNAGGSASGGGSSADNGGSYSGSSSSSGGSFGGYSGGGSSSGGSSSVYSGGGSSCGGSSGAGGGAAVSAGGAAATATAKKEKAKEKKAEKDPAYKKFSDPSGSYMELAPYGITFSPGSSSTSMLLDKSGMLSISGKKLSFLSNTTIYIGGGKEGPIQEIFAMAEKEIKAALTGGDSSITMKTDTDIKATFVKKDAELKKPALPLASAVEKELTAEDKATRDSYNADAKESLKGMAEELKKQKEEEGKRKVREGIFSILTVVASVALVVATGGAAAPLVAAMAVTGGFKTISAVADIAEGISDINKAQKGDLSQSYNFMRDTVFGGNQAAYEFTKGVNDMVFGFVTGKAVKFNLANNKTNSVVKLLGKCDSLCNKSKKANYLSNIGGDVAMGCVEDYVQNGSISPTNVLHNMALGTIKGAGMNRLQFPSGGKFFTNNPYGRKLANTAIGTGYGMLVDGVDCALRGEDYDWKQSMAQNFFQSGLGQLFGEPIDAATGAFLMVAKDYILPDIMDPVVLSRSYHSTDKRIGWMGKGWHFVYEGRLCRDGETFHVQLPDGYCTAFRLVREEGILGRDLYVDVIGNGRYHLHHDAMNGRWMVTDRHQHKAYGYSEEGLLQEVTDRNGCALTISYQGQYPQKMTTALGYEVIFTFEEDRLVKLEDGMGRTTGYRYRDGRLAEVVHMDGGIFRYDYNKEGYLTRPTDQTGLCYLENTYDEKGRVTLQTLANGETYRAEYLDRERKVCVEYSAYPGKKVYTYNEKMEITQVLYPDGTKETFAFDARHNRILETDRMGRSIHKKYDATGYLIKEIRPEGLETEYIYNHTGDLEIIRDNGGRQTTFVYDENHNLTARKQKTGEGSWSKESYAYDWMGRLTQEQDGEGHATRYCYEKQSAYPYRTIHADGSELVCEYDRSGRRLWEEDSAGRTEYGYNRSGWQTMVRDGEGNETHFLYDGMGRKLACYSPKQWKEKKGKRTEYRYDFLERLMDTEYADGSHEKLVRDGEGNILKEVHPNAYDPVTKDGDGTVYEYDSDNRLLRIRYPDGGVERFFYDGAGNRMKHVLPEQYDAERDDGEGWNYAYDEGNRLIAMTGPDGVVEETYAYDLWGNCVRKTDADGYTTHYTYDLEGRMIQKLEPSGESREDISYCKTVYTYDNNGNRIREIRCGGRYGEDGSLLETGTDLVLTFIYDTWNRLVRVEDGLGARTSYSYDVRGNRVSEEQVIGTVTDENTDSSRTVLRRIRYIYDKAGRMIEKREVIDSGLAETNNRLEAKNNRENTETVTTVTAVTRYGYDANGNRIKIVTPEGYHISRDYDERDRLIMERVEDKENGIDLKTYITYDRAGNILSVRQKGAEGKERAVAYDYDLKDRLIRMEEMDGPIFFAVYDKNDQVSSQKELLATEKESYRETIYNYDSFGNLTKRYRNGVLEERKRYDQKKRLIQNTDGDGVEVRCRYGIQDEQREIITANSRQLKRAVQKLSYNARGQITGVEGGCGAKTGYTLDGWGRITSIQTAEGGQEKYAYDYAGNIIETTDANGGIIRYAYNSQGKVCAITDQSGKTETFRYDKEGREIEHIDRNGTVTQTRYNVYRQLVLKVCTDAKGRREVMGTWEYDSFGQLKKSVAGGFCYTYEYRPDGKLLRKWSNGRKVIDCTYYRDGSLKSLWDVSGKSTIYEYDGQGYLKSLKDETGKVLTEYRYTKAGRLKEVLTPEGMNTTYGYDADGNLNRLTIGNSNDRTLLYDAFIGYDLNGNRTEKNGILLSIDGKEQKMATIYRYDAMNRLTEEKRGGDGEKYAYDLNGNRLKKERYRNGIVDAVETYCYNERNELTEKKNTSGLITYSYDASGSLLKEKSAGKTSEYRYDLLNRLTYVYTLDGREQKNCYDGEGFRAGLTESGKSSAFVFHNGEILAECNEENAPVRRHILGMGLSHMQTLDDYTYHTVHKDEQWSTAYITNESGQVENCYQYDAFGNLLESKESIQNRMLYTGQQYDQETGQYYLRARYYNPVIGRFTQEDIYRGDGLNLYAYCANNPVMYYDPSGYAKKCPPSNQAEVEQPKGSCQSGTSSLQDIANKTAQEYNAKYNPYERAKSKGYTNVKKTANGGVSFEGSEYMYYHNGQEARKAIQATGNRNNDFKMANQAMGLSETPDGYVWHHLDDYNVEKNTITMELVMDEAHNASKPHSGGCAQYDSVNGPTYNKKKKEG